MMLNLIWAGMLLLSFFAALLNGRLQALSAAVGDGAQKAVETAFLLAGGMCFWSGLMQIAEDSGIVRRTAQWLSPLIARLFPEYAGQKAVEEQITMNIAANLFGMGNAATPAGLRAMDEMQKLHDRDTPSKGMLLFVVMNTAAFQLIPSSVVQMRSSYGSADPFDVMPHIWFVSFGSLLISMAACRIMEKLWNG